MPVNGYGNSFVLQALVEAASKLLSIVLNSA